VGNLLSIGKCSIQAVISLELSALAYVTQSLGYTGTLTAGDVLEIDIDNKTVKLNGSNVRENLTGIFPLLYAESNELRWKDEDGGRDVDLEVKHKPRW
jgi:phage-related protein